MKYTEEQKKEMFNKIIESICNGVSVRQILKNDGMPTFYALLDWMQKDEELAKQYARAKQESADFDADNVNYIAELCLRDKVTPAAARVAIDAYKWSAGKKKPKKYGDMIKIDYNQIDENVKTDVDFDEIKL